MTALYGSRGTDGRRESRALLALALRVEFGLDAPPEQEPLPGGKPWFPAHPGLCFNLSHSGPLALCGVGTAPLGVDIERIRPRQEALPRYTLSDAEWDWFQARGGQWADFYTLWTLKEARVKWEGTGLRRPARTIAVPLLSLGEAGTCGDLMFRAYGGADWRAAVCIRGTALPPARITGPFYANPL